MVKKLLVLLLCICMALSSLTAFAADYTSTQYEVPKPETPKEDAAYIIFEETPVMKDMSFVDGINEDRYSVTYSEQVTFGNIPCRQVYVENYLYVALDREFASPEDRVFELKFDYWDYGGGGTFHVEYTPAGRDDYQRCTLEKLGLDENGKKTEARWRSVTVYIDDACFNGSMEYGADFRIVSNAYNAFSKIEVRNISRIAKPTDNYGYFNTRRAGVLNFLNVFDGFGTGEEFDPCLDKKLTREEFIEQMIKCYNLKDEALSKNYKPSISGVSEEAQPYIGLAEHMGVILSEDNFKPTEYFTQKEMLMYYLRILGVDGATQENSFALAEKYGINSAGSMLFQPDKEVIVDSMITPSLNVFSKENLKTGKSPFGEGFEKGIFDESTIVNSKDPSLEGWVKNNEFTIKKQEVVDELSGRTYYKINFLGQSALKEYYTENCMSMDCTRMYFRDSNFRLFEYNIETEKTNYVDTLLSDYNYMVNMQNNLYYTSKDWEIIKIDLDTYEKEVVGKIPEWQTQKPFMLQVNNAGTRLSYEWRDTKGDFDSKLYSRIPIYNIETKEWDLRFWYGFDWEWYYPDHICINPAYDNLAFFAHEGNAPSGSGQLDRVWAVNMDTNEYYNVFKQKELKKGWTGESAVHEAWSFDGEWLMAVKGIGTMDGISRGIGDAGIVILRPDTTDKRYIPGDFSFTISHGGADWMKPLHAMLNWKSDRWLVSDSSYGSGFSDLYLIDTYTAKSYFLARLNETGNNPGHVHPQFSPDDQKVIFGLWGPGNKYVEIGWMDVSDIVNNAIYGEQVNISESCDSFWYEGCDSYMIPQHDDSGNVTGYEVPAGKEMFVKVKSSVSEADQTEADVTITYLDKGYSTLAITYQTWDPSVGGIGKLTARKKYIKCNNTGKTVTTTVHFDDICLNNMDILGTDFRISGANGRVLINSVDVSVDKKE